MTAALLEWETIDMDQINDIMEGRPPRPPKTPDSGDSTPGATPSAGVPAAGSSSGNAPAAV